jgi:hypothetical protein
MENENNVIRIADLPGSIIGWARKSEMTREDRAAKVWVSDTQDGSNGRYWYRFDIREATTGRYWYR